MKVDVLIALQMKFLSRVEPPPTNIGLPVLKSTPNSSSSESSSSA